MSTTGNEFEQQDGTDQDVTGQAQSGLGDSPAAEAAASADHHGQDGARDTLTAGQAQAEMSGAAEQSLPAMSQNNASDADKVAGIVAQTRTDVSHLGRDEVVRVLAQRFDQTGVTVSDDELQELADQVTADDRG
ncbi:hypothetical protein [Microbacterium sp. SLBN-146]|uniref:hypothetical protein n=1 Tax=Microbacterium sp. SLBN-146 TaxID=2768457 RepID=UPI001174DC4C|nr:hypothetical protein [Microbacterium sp. SLBN-146]TQJ30981.1 hypothetical protein FBY39_1440 [Microbacterium sp. SLBN-146]